MKIYWCLFFSVMGLFGLQAEEIKPDPEVEKIINELKPGQSANLPNLKAIGDINEFMKRHNMHLVGPRGRDWCNKMIYMNHRKRAFFTGANHNKPRMNDAWEYDVKSNTWICLFGSDDELYEKWPKEKYDIIDGVGISKRGGPVMMGHLWWGITYNPKDKLVYYMSIWSGNRVSDGLHTGYRTPIHMPPLWTFDADNKKWIPVPKGDLKLQLGPSPVLEYLPDQHALFYYHSRESYNYDFESKKWKANSVGKLPKDDVPPQEAVYGWDPKTKNLVAHQGGYQKYEPTTFHYDPVKNTWRKIKNKKTDPWGHDGISVFCYDSKSGLHLLLTEMKEEKKTIFFSYDASKEEWKEVEFSGPKPPVKRMAGYYDPDLNLLICYGVLDGDSNSNSNFGTWVYRPN